MEEAPMKPLGIVQLVNWYMTPLAFFIVAAAAVSVGWNKITGASLATVCITVVANALFVYVAAQVPDQVLLIRAWRMGFNYMCNSALVFLLLPYWTPVWLLFLLAVIAGGVYHDRQGAMTHAAVCTFLLLTIQGYYDRLHWPMLGETLTYVAALWVVGLFVNGLVHPAESKG